MYEKLLIHNYRNNYHTISHILTKESPFSGLMGSYTKEVAYVDDPKLFDVDNPFRRHKY